MAKKLSNVNVPIDARETFVSIRKTFSEGDVALKLRSLYNLQQIDTELDKIYQLRGELPVEVEALEGKIAELNGISSLFSPSHSPSLSCNLIPAFALSTAPCIITI